MKRRTEFVGVQLAPMREDKIAACRDKAGVQRLARVAVQLAGVDGDADLAEGIEVAVEGDDGIDVARHVGGVELHVRAVAVVGDIAADLRAVGHLDLAEGDCGVAERLLPRDGKDRVVAVVLDRAAGHEGDVRIPGQGLAAEQRGGRLDHGLNDGRIIRLAETGRIGLWRDQRALGDRVVPLDIGEILQRVGVDVVVDELLKAAGKIRLGRAGRAGRARGGRAGRALRGGGGRGEIGVDVPGDPQEQQQTQREERDPEQTIGERKSVIFLALHRFLSSFQRTAPPVSAPYRVLSGTIIHSPPSFTRRMFSPVAA